MTTDTSVKYFHSEMANSPVLAGVSARLIDVADACLINGWGLVTAQSVTVSGGVATATFAGSHSFEIDVVLLVAGAVEAGVNGEHRATATTVNSVSFPVTGVADGVVSGTITVKLAPAGWSKAFAGANKAAYRSLSPSATGAYIRIEHASAKFARLRAYSAMTDIDTGSDPTPTDAQVAGGCYVPVSNVADTSSRRWILVASDRFMLILIAHHASYPVDYGLQVAGDFPSLKSGDAYRVCVVGEIGDNSSLGSPGTYSSIHASGGGVGGYAMRSYPQVGGAIPIYLYKPGFVQGVPSGHPTHPVGPNPINNGLDICPTLFLEQGANGSRRGEIPGVYGIPHNLGAAFDSKEQIGAVVGLPGHKLIAVRYYGTTSLTTSYRAAIDITGPWE